MQVVGTESPIMHRGGCGHENRCWERAGRGGRRRLPGGGSDPRAGVGPPDPRRTRAGDGGGGGGDAGGGVDLRCQRRSRSATSHASRVWGEWRTSSPIRPVPRWRKWKPASSAPWAAA